MGEAIGPWLRAVSEASEFPPADMAEAVVRELARLWNDLHLARHYALKNSWSVTCDDLSARIVELTRLSAATPWRYGSGHARPASSAVTAAPVRP